MIFFIYIFFFTIIAYPSYAYIDPGSGSILLQIVGSILAGFLFFFTYIKLKFKNIYKKIFKKKKEE